MKKLLLMLAAVMMLGGVLTACGGGGGEQQSAPAVEPNGNTVDLAIEGANFQFDQAEYRVKSGDTVNVSYTDAEGMHGIEIAGTDVKLKNGDTASFVAQPGEYDIICTIMCGSGHAQMRSKLIVE